MRRKIVNSAAVAIAAAVMMMNTMPVLAYTEVAGGTTTFNKYLVMDTDTNVPNLEFTFNVTPGTATDSILAGVGTPVITTDDNTTEDGAQLAFIPGMSTSTDTTGERVKEFDSSTQKYAKKTATIDFSGCKFEKPGIYRYVITESKNSESAVTNDTNAYRYLDVYVEDVNGALKVASYVLHATDTEITGTKDDNGNITWNAENDTKSQGYTNNYETVDLTVKEEVYGNMADKTKEFQYHLELEDSIPGNEYTVTIKDESDNVIKTDTITVDEDGKVSYDFKLKHGDTIEIPGISKDTKYKVTVENGTDDGYTESKENIDGYTDLVSGTLDEDKDTSYKHTKEGLIPTGVIMTVAPFAAVTLLGGAGAVALKMKKKREEDDEE